MRNVQVGTDGRTPLAVVSSSVSTQGKENLSSEVKREGKGKSAVKEEEMLPLVEFRMAHGTEIVLLGREEFRVEDNEGKLLARRIQVCILS